MSFYKTTCPYCHTEHVSFRSIVATRHINKNDLYSVYFTCNHCDNGIVMLAECHTTPDPHQYQGNLNTYSLCKVILTRPEVERPDIPKHLPENIEKIFVQAAYNSRKSGFEDSTGAMCRKTLEKALSIIDPETAGMKLYNRIEKCAEKNLITPSLKDWAHIIRDDGNEASHDEFNADKAQSLFNFTYMFLTYTFTLPGMMLEKQQK